MWKFNPIIRKWEYIAEDPGSKAYNKELTNQPLINDNSDLLNTMDRVFERKKIMSDPNLDQETRNQMENEKVFDPYKYQTEESNKEALLKGDPRNEQYFKYEGRARDRFGKEILTTDNPYQMIAKDQGFGEQFGRKMGNLLPNVALGIIESFGYLGELPGVISGNDRDFSNEITEWAKGARNDVFGDVYQMQPNKAIDLSDSAWWLNNGFDLLESIGEFAATGATVGGLLGKAAKGLSTVMKLGKTGSKLLNIGLAQIPTSAALSYTEGAMSGADIYKQVYDDTLRRTGNEQYAQEQASNSAATTVGLNTAINTALNLYSVGSMFTNPVKSSIISKKFGFGKLAGESVDDYATRLASMSNEYMPSKMASLKKYLAEAPLESAEELVNVFAEKRGRVKGGLEESKRWIDDLIESAKSDEGVLSMALGAIGGIGNIAVMNNLPSIGKDESGKLKLDPSARQQELTQNKAVYAAQLNALKSDLTDFVTNKDDLQKAAETGDVNKMKETKEKLFNIGLNRAIVEGNADSMIATLQQVSSVDNTIVGEDGKTEAMRQGLTESTLDNSYKQIAEKKIVSVKELADEYKEIEQRYTPAELEAPGFLRHISKANVDYKSAQDGLEEARLNYTKKAVAMENYRTSLQDVLLILNKKDGTPMTEEEQKKLLKSKLGVYSQFDNSKEKREFDESKKEIEKAEKQFIEAKDNLNKAYDFDAYKKSLEKTVGEITSSKQDEENKQITADATQAELNSKLSNAGYQRTGKVGEYFAFNKEGKNFLAERVQTPKGSKVYIKDPETGRYMVDKKGVNEEFTLDYYTKNRDIAIVPRQQYLDERKADILRRSKEAQVAAIESVINDYEQKIKNINETIPKYQQDIKSLNDELTTLKSDIEKLLQKNRQTKLSKKAIRQRIKEINSIISQTEQKITTARETRDNIQNSIDTLRGFEQQLQLIPESQMVSFNNILKDTQFIMDSSTKTTQQDLENIVKDLEDIIFNLNAERDRLSDIANVLEELLASDELFSSIASKNIKVATFLDKYPGFPAGLLQDTTKLLDSDLNKLAVINYIKRIAAGQNQPYKVVKQQMIDDLAPLADEELTAMERQVVENDLQATLSELREVKDRLAGYLNDYLNAKEKQRDITELQNQFTVLDKHIAVLSDRYSKQLIKDEKKSNVDRSQEAGTEQEIHEVSETEEKRVRDSFLSDFIFYTTGRNLKFDENGTLYDAEGDPIFEEGYQQRWFKFLDKHSRDIEPSEDNESSYALKAFVRGASNTPKEINDLMDEEVGDKVEKDSLDIGVFLVDNKGEYVKVDAKGDRDTNGIPAFTFLPRLDSLLPTNGEPKVTWRAISSLYQTIHGGSMPSIKNKADNDIVKFQSREISVADFKSIILNEARSFYKNFVEKIANTKDVNVQLEIGAVTNGISLRKKDKDGKTRTQTLEQLLKSAKSEIEAIHISKFKESLTIRGIGYEYDPGTVIVELKSGAVFPVHTTTLSDNDVDTAIYLISQGKFGLNGEVTLGTFEKDGKKIEKYTTGGLKKVRIFPKTRADKFSLLGNLINWGKHDVTNPVDKKHDIYIEKGYVHFSDVTNNYNRIRLELTDVLNKDKNQKLREFLADKKYNVSSKAVNSNAKYFHPVVKDNKIEFKEYNSYEDYLANKIKTFTFVSKDGQMMASKNIVLATDGKGLPIIKNTKIETTVKKNVVKEDEVTEPTEEMTAGLAAFGLTYRTETKSDQEQQVEDKQDEANKLIEEVKKKSKRVSIKDSVEGINTPVEDPYYGVGKERWDTLSEEEKRTIKEQKDQC